MPPYFPWNQRLLPTSTCRCMWRNPKSVKTADAWEALLFNIFWNDREISEFYVVFKEGKMPQVPENECIRYISGKIYPGSILLYHISDEIRNENSCFCTWFTELLTRANLVKLLLSVSAAIIIRQVHILFYSDFIFKVPFPVVHVCYDVYDTNYILWLSHFVVSFIIALNDLILASSGEQASWITFVSALW